jgi:uncharacterized circularly permuted ATP-grasp superfamily protein
MVASLGLVKNHSMPALLKYELDGAYDEMFAGPGTPRSHYQALYRTLLELAPADLRAIQQAADLSFLHQGITFTVYGNEEARSAFSRMIFCLVSSLLKSGASSSVA